MSWNLHDKNGKYRSRRAFKSDCSQDSEEPWEINRKKKGGLTSLMDLTKMFK